MRSRACARVAVSAMATGSKFTARPYSAEISAKSASTSGASAIAAPRKWIASAALAQARDLIHASGVDVGILFDTWHLVRAGCGPEHLRQIEPGLIRYVQVNDGLARIAPEAMIGESLQERLYPGEGAFPLVDLLKAAPRDVPWAIETPSLRRAQAGITAEAQARETMALMRGLVAAIDR
jgi:sugar phosphate isomerase/epimerase